MKPSTLRIEVAIVAAMLTIAGLLPASGESLGDILRETGWDRIIGTWIDEETNGGQIKVSYAWKFEDRLLIANSKAGELKSVSLIGLNAKTGEVYLMGADSAGAGSLGKWEIEDGDAVLELGFVSGEGEEGGLRFRHHLEDDDTLVVTMEGEEPVTVRLVRGEE